MRERSDSAASYANAGIEFEVRDDRIDHRLRHQRGTSVIEVDARRATRRVPTHPSNVDVRIGRARPQRADSRTCRSISITTRTTAPVNVTLAATVTGTSWVAIAYAIQHNWDVARSVHALTETAQSPAERARATDCRVRGGSQTARLRWRRSRGTLVGQRAANPGHGVGAARRGGVVAPRGARSPWLLDYGCSSMPASVSASARSRQSRRATIRPSRTVNIVTVVRVAHAVGVRAWGSHSHDNLVAVPDHLLQLGTQAALDLLCACGFQLTTAVADLQNRVGDAGIEVCPLQVRIDQIQHRRRVTDLLGRVGPPDESNVRVRHHKSSARHERDAVWGAKPPERKAALAAHPGHGRPGGRNTTPAGGYDGHRPRLSGGTSREVRINRTGAQRQYQT
jgi:hypothetical protein